MLGLKRKSLVGLDIDASAVRMVQLRRDSTGYVVARAGVSDIAPWGGDPELRRIHTTRAISHGFANHDIRGRSVVCGLRGPEVVVRDFEFPALPPEEIGPAVELEVSQICPFLTDESTLDYQVTSNPDKQTMGFWVAATNSLIESTRQLVRAAALHCALVDVAGLALLNLLEGGWRRAEGRSENPVDTNETAALRNPRALPPAILDVGDSCATLALIDHAGRPCVRDVGRGSEEVLRRVARDTRRTPEAVRDALFAEDRALSAAGGHPPDRALADDRDIAASLERACADLVEDVATTLRYYASQNGSARVHRLLVCGSLATRELIELLRLKLHLDVEPWNPLARMRCEAQECELLVREAGSTLAVAAGLAMRQV